MLLLEAGPDWRSADAPTEVDNLWVADASVFPAVPRANTNLPTIEAAERLCDLIRDDCSDASAAALSGGRPGSHQWNSDPPAITVS